MSTQKAVVCASKGVSELRNDVPLPKLPADNWLLVKTKAVALNPIALDPDNPSSQAEPRTDDGLQLEPRAASLGRQRQALLLGVTMLV